ncbi:N-acetylneuraminate epimerase [Pirellulimonas nuda]|uniref:N-acetylneuraminate epimerase n=1 Tax=Pirellulimonas nuda TaxID=2528009 RepID=A0A518D675_9BACT|nr:hypothetical protein [Pirellulimonas nuda]QDU86971.1 N-acetylneuraminate epimerase [Pirellulimonas nuda]
MKLPITLALTLAAATAQAHFPWLAADPDGAVRLYFSETPAERDYKLPEAVKNAKVQWTNPQGKTTTLEMKAVEEGPFLGRVSEAGAATAGVVTAECQYGVYHGALLTYYAKAYLGAQPGAWRVPEAKKQPALDAVAERVEGGVQLTVYRDGKPLKGATVTLIDPAGETASEDSDKRGEAVFRSLSKGLVGFTVGYVDEDAKGEVDGAKYESAMQYATLTLDYDPATPLAGRAKLAPLAEGLSSFGAAVAGDYVYVYSGHTGEAHDHSKENLSQHFRRAPLAGGPWEDLAMQTPLQGLALVAHNGKLYRVGGMSATNDVNEEAEMHSVDEFAAFDPETGAWTALAPLPAARSSHDAVVIGDKLYVSGGWKLAGEGEGEWQESGCVYDFNNPVAGWQAIPAPPTRRRALAAAQWRGGLVLLGGMNADHAISRKVEWLNPETNQWQTLADLPGAGMDGFGVSAWGMNDKLYASGMQGVLVELSDDGKQWTPVAELQTPRFFHRLLPVGDALIAIGGAAEQGHLTSIEQVAVGG